jgi:hypothetical protein
MAYNESLRIARHDYVEASIAELNAVCNLIENDNVELIHEIKKHTIILSAHANELFSEFIAIAKSVNPQNTALVEMEFHQPEIVASGDES